MNGPIQLKCQVILAKYNHERFTVTFIRNGEVMRERVWKAQNTIRDSLIKSGALREGPISWPKNIGDKTIFKLKDPVRWYWED